MVLLIICILTLTIILRLVVLWLNLKHFNRSKYETGDSAGHQLFILQLKKKFKSKLIDKYLIKDDEIISYPLFFHRIASVFSFKFIQKKYPFNLFSYIFFSLLINLILVYLNYNYSFIIIYNLFFITSISNNIFFKNNIAYLDLGERFTSKALVSLYFFLSYNYIMDENFDLLIIITILIPIIFSISKFARQTILFTIIPLFYFKIDLLFSFSIGIFFLLIFDGKKFLLSMKSQIIHLYYYKTNIAKSFIAKHALSSFLNLSDFSFKSLKKIINVEPLRSFLFLPEFFLINVLSFYLEFNPIAFTISASILLVYIITTTKKLNFLGESFRYIEYTFYFLGPFFLTKLLLDYNYLIVMILGYNVLFIVLFYLMKKNSSNDKFKKDLEDILDKNIFQENSNVLTIPLRTIHAILLNSEAKGIWWQPGSINKYIINNILEQYPFPNKNLDFFKQRYNVNTIVFEKQFDLKLPWDYNLKNYKLLYENDTFKVYNI